MLRTVLSVSIALLPLTAAAAHCAFQAERSLDVDARALTVLKLDTGAGDLVVDGVAGLDRIELRGKACASDEKALAATQFSAQREGNVAVAATNIPASHGGLFGGSQAYMDVHVRMPAAMKLELRDSSGDLEVSGVRGGLGLQDSSGDITLRDLAGDVRIADTSGDIEVDGVEGNVVVDADSSGDIEIEKVSGDALVHEDSSGDITFEHVGGSAGVDRDSSGGIAFEDIGGDANVGSDSSGDIRATDVRGNFSVRSKANVDAIHYTGIAGQVSLPPAR